MVATATAPEIQLIAIDKIDAHPQNPRGELRKNDPEILELKASIDKLGQKIPCLLRPKSGGRFEAVLGHRRRFVQELRGEEKVPCVVEDLSDELALAIMLADHATHVAPDPFLEGEAVAELLGRPGWNLRHVADHLGKSARWVAQRANLKNLSAKLKKKLPGWPVEWLEDLARLAPEAQDALELQQLNWINSKRQLDEFIGRQFNLLSKAIWKLDDATLVPAAGSCLDCPKTSLRSPGLFDDGDVDPYDPKALKKSICRDAPCFQAKREAAAKARIAELKAEHPAALVVKEGYNAPIPKDVKTVESYKLEQVKQSSKGAKPAIYVDDAGKAKLEWVKESSFGVSSSKKPKKEKPAKEEPFPVRLKRSQEEIAKRREKYSHEAVLAALDELMTKPKNAKTVSTHVLEGLICAFGAGPPEYVAGPAGQGPGKALARVKKLHELGLTGEVEGFREELLPRVLEVAVEDMRYGYGEDEVAIARWLAGVLLIDLSAIDAAAVEKIPDPKWWGKAEPAKPSIKAVGKKLLDGAAGELQKAGLLSGAGVEEGICRGCHCTHDRACPGGCTWVEKPKSTHTLLDGDRHLPVGLCSSCAGAQPKGKKASKKKVKA